MLIGKLFIYELTIKQRGDEKDEKEEKKKSIALKAIQEASEDESLVDSSEDDDKIAMITRGFKKFLKRKCFSRQRDHKKNKEVTCYECKKSGHISSECPKLKFNNKGAKDKKKAFKAS